MELDINYRRGEYIKVREIIQSHRHSFDGGLCQFLDYDITDYPELMTQAPQHIRLRMLEYDTWQAGSWHWYDSKDYQSRIDMLERALEILDREDELWGEWEEKRRQII